MYQPLRRVLRSAIMTCKGPPDPLIVVIGATGTGKSQLAVEIARRFNGEVINADAMQMYEGLPIITNKITEDEKQGVPHHLLSVVGLGEEPWRVGVFRKKASSVIKEIRSRGKLPIVVGGTHYYTQSLLFSDALAAEVEEGDTEEERSSAEIGMKFPILESSTEEMLAQLREVDPVIASRWHPNDRRKIRRSLEIYLTTGKRASETYQSQKEKYHPSTSVEAATNNLHQPPAPALLQKSLILWVHAEAATLKSRLDARVDKMVNAGLIPEVTSLQHVLDVHPASLAPIDRTRGIWVSIGFKEFTPYLTASPDNAPAALTLSIDQTKAATRQYAKSQVRWIRIKLFAALSRTNSLDSLYLLDGTSLFTWSEHVSEPAISLCAAFLAGKEMPKPESLSEAAREMLAPERDFDLSDRSDLWVRKVCDVCGVVTVTEELWKMHVSGRRHKRTVRKHNGRLGNRRESVEENGSEEVGTSP